MKTCYVCGIEKPYEQFSKCKANKDGLQYNCKTCATILSNKWNSSNKEKVKKIHKKYKNKRRSSEGIGVYGLWNKTEQCYDYIGEGQLKNREDSHKLGLNASTPVEIKLNVWFDGFDSVYEFRVLCKCDTKEQCKEMETKYINELQPRYNKRKRQHKVEA